MGDRSWDLDLLFWTDCGIEYEMNYYAMLNMVKGKNNLYHISGCTSNKIHDLWKYVKYTPTLCERY